MKQLMAAILALALALCMTAALAEETPFVIRNNVTFGMNMDQVIDAENTRRYEIDSEHNRGRVEFWELEYEHMTENGVPADIHYLFVGNELVAVRFEYEARDISAQQLKADLAADFGAFGALDRDVLGNGIYAVDDDGRPEGRVEAAVNGNVMVVIAQDEDDIDVTFIDLTAAYIK
ncbi:MAG: hypothetical protein IKH38_04960 [Clostridia bacterium]|nr:hypothetical protein [Clostridia bacterium]